MHEKHEPLGFFLLSQLGRRILRTMVEIESEISSVICQIAFFSVKLSGVPERVNAARVFLRRRISHARHAQLPRSLY